MKTAVVLFNLGGPDRLSSVKPFLFNLFNDAAILTLPQPFRYLLAKWISWRRTHEAREIYSKLGGKSPLLENTQAQANALESLLGGKHKVFVCMRYWHPMTQEVVKAVKHYNPDRIVLLPLYPQFSTTTTGSSYKEWKKFARHYRLDKPTHFIGCYPENPGFISAVTTLILDHLKKLKSSKIRILFSAHGLPQKFIDNGDPYQWHVEQTVKAVLSFLPESDFEPVICYQSRVGPLEWIKPYTDLEIIRAGREGYAVMIVPIAFVSEHSETLVEIGMQYKDLAEKNGVPEYVSVPTVSLQGTFIQGLADLVRSTEKTNMLTTHEISCKSKFTKCCLKECK